MSLNQKHCKGAVDELWPVAFIEQQLKVPAKCSNQRSWRHTVSRSIIILSVFVRYLLIQGPPHSLRKETGIRRHTNIRADIRDDISRGTYSEVASTAPWDYELRHRGAEQQVPDQTALDDLLSTPLKHECPKGVTNVERVWRPT
ncbi:hypothetical protein RRG08_044142 [Elysia crispata]|uniref:Uncharacterized protein n=1 Tax=Elysia crispata TaxID=231223 RepID=A0AAE0Z8X9_9GAST|nr:hypothetical protein RRG08_044142 [Elysia crispata]